MNAWAPRALCSAEGVLLYVCESVVFVWYWAEPDTSPTVALCDLGRGIVDCRRSLLCPGGVTHWTLGPHHISVAGTYYHCLAGRSLAPDAARTGTQGRRRVPGSNTRGYRFFVFSPGNVPGDYIFYEFYEFTGFSPVFLLFTLYEAGWPVLYVWCSRHL